MYEYVHLINQNTHTNMFLCITMTTKSNKDNTNIQTAQDLIVWV